MTIIDYYCFYQPGISATAVSQYVYSGIARRNTVVLIDLSSVASAPYRPAQHDYNQTEQARYL